MLKNWCFWIVVLDKTLESPLDCKEIQPVHPKENQSWVFIGRTDAELKLQYFGHLMQRADAFEKTLMLGRIEGRRRRGDNRGWDGWLASRTQWTWVWVNFGSWWRTGRPGVLQSMGSQSTRLSELNWSPAVWWCHSQPFWPKSPSWVSPHKYWCVVTGFPAASTLGSSVGWQTLALSVSPCSQPLQLLSIHNTPFIPESHRCAKHVGSLEVVLSSTCQSRSTHREILFFCQKWTGGPLDVAWCSHKGSWEWGKSVYFSQSALCQSQASGLSKRTLPFPQVQLCTLLCCGRSRGVLCLLRQKAGSECSVWSVSSRKAQGCSREMELGVVSEKTCQQGSSMDLWWSLWEDLRWHGRLLRVSSREMIQFDLAKTLPWCKGLRQPGSQEGTVPSLLTLATSSGPTNLHQV